MRIALIHDWLTGMRGGEKCLEVFCELYPEADLYTLLHIPGKLSPAIERMNIQTSFIQSLPRAQSLYRNYLPLFPTAIEQFNLRGYELVLSTSHCVAKGVITQPQTCHVSYIHTPMRYVWELYHDYFGEDKIGWFMRRIIPPITNYLRMWDVASANRVDYYIANSRHVAKRIRKHYNREATVINPPVNTDLFELSKTDGDFYLIVSALAPYKRIDLAIETFNRLKLPLKIVGIGESEKRLRQIAGPTVEFLGWLSDTEVRDHYMNCRAFVFPQEEDFGITPLEAQACGKPVIAFGKGGALETVIGEYAEDGEGARPASTDSREWISGIFFREQTVEALSNAVRYFEKNAGRFDPERIRNHALKFSTSAFRDKIRDFVSWKFEEFKARTVQKG